MHLCGMNHLLFLSMDDFFLSKDQTLKCKRKNSRWFLLIAFFGETKASTTTIILCKVAFIDEATRRKVKSCALRKPFNFLAQFQITTLLTDIGDSFRAGTDGMTYQ